MKATVVSGISIVLAVLVAGGATAWLVAGRGAKPRTHSIGSEVVDSSSTGSSRGDGDENAALRRRLAELELKVAALSTQAAARSGDEAADTAATPEEPTSFEEQVKLDRAVWEDHMAEVAQSFEAETRDGRWAQDKANLLTTRAQADTAMRAAIKEVECRSATCRVEMVDDQKGDFARQLPIFVNGLGGVFPMAEARTVDNADGTRTLNLYFSSTANPDPRGG